MSFLPVHSFYHQCDPRTRPSNNKQGFTLEGLHGGLHGGQHRGRPHEHTYLTQHDVHLMIVENCLSLGSNLCMHAGVVHWHDCVQRNLLNTKACRFTHKSSTVQYGCGDWLVSPRVAHAAVVKESSSYTWCNPLDGCFRVAASYWPLVNQ